MQQGAVAVRRACADAGVGWQDMEFAYGGSQSAGDPDRMVSMLGLTGFQFINVYNGCAPGGSALASAYNTIKSGAFDAGIAIGFDKHERGAFNPSSQTGAGADWYGANNEVFCHEGQPLHGDLWHHRPIACAGVCQSISQRGN
jgi:acetyl-CoA acetyltransferase